MKHRHDDIFSNFESYFGYIAKDTFDWYPVGDSEILIKTVGGGRYIYNDNSKTIQNITNRRIDDEQKWQKEVGDRIYHLMKLRGYTQVELSNETGISQSLIHRYLTGKTSPSYYNITKLAAAFKCSINEFSYFNDHEKGEL